MKRNSLLKRQCGLMIGALTLSSATAVVADIPAFELGDVLSTQPASFTGTRGWQFLSASGGYDIFITQLGVFDSGGDGLVNSHEIGLWRDNFDNVTGTLLASATVPAGTVAPLEWGCRWVLIPPVRIPYTVASYVVGAWYSAGDADDLVTPRPSGPWPAFEFGPGIGAETGGARVRSGNEPQYPAASWGCGEGCIPEIFWEANFQYTLVPEPSVWVLLVPGCFCLFWGVRSRR